MEFSDSYPLKPFQEPHYEKLAKVISAYPLATVISQDGDFPVVTQVPLILDQANHKLLGHFDRNNPHCAHIEKGGPITCIFNGPNYYMTPEIYPDLQYPGWNYVAVHVRGHVRPMATEEQLSDLLIRTAEENEPEGSSYTLTPNQRNFHIYIKMILGFEIDILDMKGVFKLAQDKGQPHIELAKKHLAKMSQKDVTDFLDEMLHTQEQ